MSQNKHSSQEEVGADSRETAVVRGICEAKEGDRVRVVTPEGEFEGVVSVDETMFTRETGSQQDSIRFGDADEPQRSWMDVSYSYAAGTNPLPFVEKVGESEREIGGETRTKSEIETRGELLDVRVVEQADECRGSEWCSQTASFEATIAGYALCGDHDTQENRDALDEEGSAEPSASDLTEREDE